MERAEDRLADRERSALDLGDVDVLIQQLEAQYQGSHVLPMREMAPTNGCTVATGCTGSCPCGIEVVEGVDER